jgi:hypothetical protein
MTGRLERVWLAPFVTLVTGLLPAVVHACPMCFNGKDSNSDAFLYGSLFLMFVPVSALGGLAYWAYRRIKAADSHNAADDAQSEASQPGVVLRIAERR